MEAAGAWHGGPGCCLGARALGALGPRGWPPGRGGPALARGARVKLHRTCKRNSPFQSGREPCSRRRAPGSPPRQSGVSAEPGAPEVQALRAGGQPRGGRTGGPPAPPTSPDGLARAGAERAGAGAPLPVCGCRPLRILSGIFGKVVGAAGLESGAQETFWRTLGITDVSLLLEISGSASSLLRNGFPWWMAEGWG